MIFKPLITIIVGFVAVVIVIPLLLSAVGIDIVPGRGAGATSAVLLFRSGDNGVRWEPAIFVRGRRDPAPAHVYDVASDPTATTTLFAGTKGAGLWKSEDTGITWRPTRDSAGVMNPQSDIYRVVVSSSSPVIIHVAAYQDSRGRVFRSEDGGASFREIYFTGQKQYGVFDLFIPPGEPNTVMAATGEGRVLVSEDAGRRWRFSKVLRDPAARITMHPWYANEGYLLTSRGQMFRTYNRGATWEDLGLPSRVLRAANRRVIEHPFSRVSFTPGRVGAGRQTLRDAVVVDPYRPGLVYRTSNGSIMKSVDSGASWQILSTFIDGLNVPVGGVAVHPAERDTIMVSAGSAVYTSRDTGVNWSIASIPNQNPLREIYIHPYAPRVMFVAAGR